MNPENPPTPSPVVQEPIPKKDRPRSWTWLKWTIGVGLILFLLAALTAPEVLRCRKKPDQTQATSNARQLGMALFEFATDYGRLPDDSTATAVKENTSTKWALGNGSSNALFKQLIASGIVQSEEMFYAKGKGTKKPDNKSATEADALAKGECGFAYIPLGTMEGNSARPLALCPVLPGTHKFDPKPFDGKAIVLRMDNSVQSYQIAPDGHIVAPGGGDLLDPNHPLWGGKMPEVKWPDLLPVEPVEEAQSYVPWICTGGIAFILIVTMIGACRRAIHRTRLPIGEPLPEEAGETEEFIP